MKHQITALVIALIWPVIMIYLGMIFSNKPVKHKYTILWHQLTFSYKYPRAWDYIHVYCGKRLLWMGRVCVLLSAIALLIIFCVDGEIAFRVSGIMHVIYFCLFSGTILWSNAELKEKFSKTAKIE